jgi:hypothetical protein
MESTQIHCEVTGKMQHVNTISRLQIKHDDPLGVVELTMHTPGMMADHRTAVQSLLPVTTDNWWDSHRPFEKQPLIVRQEPMLSMLAQQCCGREICQARESSPEGQQQSAAACYADNRLRLRYSCCSRSFKHIKAYTTY